MSLDITGGFNRMLATLMDQSRRAKRDKMLRNYRWFVEIFMAEDHFIRFDPESEECKTNGINSISAHILWHYPSEFKKGAVQRIRKRMGTMARVKLVMQYRESVRGVIRAFSEYINGLSIQAGELKYCLYLVHLPDASGRVICITDDPKRTIDGVEVIELVWAYNRRQCKQGIERKIRNAANYQPQGMIDEEASKALVSRVDDYFANMEGL